MKFLNRRRVHGAVPTADITPEVIERLRQLEPAWLVDVVMEPDEPWWRRRVCAKALAGRVPEANVDELISVVATPGESESVRSQILETLATPGSAHAAQLLGLLRGMKTDGPKDYDLDIAVGKARAALGDVSAFPALSELAANASRHRREAGEQALDVLLQQVGEQAMLDEFGAKTVEALAFQQQRPMAQRLLGVRLVHRGGGDVSGALGDSSVIVAEQAARLLSSTTGGDDALWERVHKRAPGHLWALVVLHRRGVDIRADWQALGPPLIELPAVPQNVREAIVRDNAPGERQTDPRWILEAAMLGGRVELTDEEEAAHIERATRVLREAGLRPEKAVDCGALHHQGGGTYWEIRTVEGAVNVSILGTFFSATGRAVDALRADGWTHIDEKLGGIEFEGLHVYFFGRRDPLPVSDLIFYWQD